MDQLRSRKNDNVSSPMCNIHPELRHPGVPSRTVELKNEGVTIAIIDVQVRDDGFGIPNCDRRDQVMVVDKLLIIWEAILFSSLACLLPSGHSASVPQGFLARAKPPPLRCSGSPR